MYRVCIAIVIIFMFIAMVLPKQFMAIYTSDTAVILEGAKYLRVVSIGYIFYGITNATIMMLRSINTVKISLVVYSISLIVNGVFNWIFIFGKLGAPRLEVTGAAIGTVIARVVEFVIVFIFIFKYEDKIKLKLKDLLPINKIMLKDFRNVCIPVLFNELLWSTGSTMLSIVVGRLGTDVVAANSINNIAFQFVTVFAWGVSSAASVVIGNTIGAGKKHKAKEYAYTIGIISIFMAIMASIIVFNIRHILVHFYNVSDTTKSIAVAIMGVTAVIILFQIVGVNMMMGVLRGGGDAKFVLINDLVFMWLVAIPLGFIAAFVWEWPIVAVFFIMKIDEIIKAGVAIVRVASGKWIKDVTRDF